MVKQITCPVCNGTKGQWEIIYHDDTGEWEEPFEYCSNCRGFGTVVVPGLDVWLVEIVTRPDYTSRVWNVVENLEDAVDSAFEYFYTSPYSMYSGSWASEPELQPNGDYLVHVFAHDGYNIAYLELAHWVKE